MMPRLPTLALLAFAAAPALAGPIESRIETDQVVLIVRADRSTLTTAETLVLRVEASVPAGAEVAWPTLEGALGEFTIIDHLGLPPKRAVGGRTLARAWTLSPFLPGQYQIPPIEVTFTLPTGESFALRSQPMTIEVTTLLDEEPADLSIGEPAAPALLPEDPAPQDYWPWIAGAAGAGALAAAAAALVINRRARRERPAEDPIRAARLGLAALAAAVEAEAEAADPLRIDELARPALARLLGAREAGITSAELADLGRRLLPAPALAALERYLAAADQALYSGRAADTAALLRHASGAVEALFAWRTSLREGLRDGLREGPREGGRPL